MAAMGGTDGDEIETLSGDPTLVLPEFDEPPEDPLPLLERWLRLADERGVREPRALALATADAEGRPSSRILLLKQVTPALVFSGSYESRKGRELKANPSQGRHFYEGWTTGFEPATAWTTSGSSCCVVAAILSEIAGLFPASAEARFCPNMHRYEGICEVISNRATTLPPPPAVSPHPIHLARDMSYPAGTCGRRERAGSSPSGAVATVPASAS